jgi:glycosyltransferase involved in cell wall biosynthesis
MTAKIAFVIPWYGEEIRGGAESLCRATVKGLLNAGVAAEVLTTCVKEFLSDWNQNFHPEGTSCEHGVPVRRFRVRRRETAIFDKVNYKLMNNLPLTSAEEDLFMAEMINSPDLYSYISAHRDEYVFLFIPYMFGTTYWGSRACPERSVLVPCLHDEAYARMRLVRRMCQSVKGLIFNSDEEKLLAERLYRLDGIPTVVAGVPVDGDWQADPRSFQAKYGLSDFFLYAGRTDKGKGHDLLIEYFCRYWDETGRTEKLVFIGGGELKIPAGYASRIIQLGFLPVPDKYDAFAAAIALCVPSRMESFSIVMMENWLAGRPTVVNASCRVTREFCIQSNGGLYFSDYDEFSEIVRLLSDDRSLSGALGASGRQYVLDNFHPDAVAARYQNALQSWGFQLSRQ